MSDNQHFPSDVVQAIKDSVQPVEVMDGDLSYFSKPLYLPPSEPTVETLDVHTLTGVRDFCLHAAGEPLLIHVLKHSQVAVYGPENGRHKQCDRYVFADCKPVIGNGFRFGEWMSIESFIINLQANFVDSDDRAALLAVVGNLASENVRTLEDDGVSQAVETRSRLAQRNVTRVPNPATLRPYRTFPEVSQPASEFVFRLKQGREGEMPQAALFEADGGMWKLQAIERIKDWLSAELADGDAASIPIIA